MARNIIVIGGSAGAFEPLRDLVSTLPEELPAALFIALHYPVSGVSRLPELLTKASTLRAEHAEDGAPIEMSRIYVAPPGRHLVLQREIMRVSPAATEHSRRSAIDVLFQSAAYAHRDRVLAIVLSGALDDGSEGVIEVKRHGGLAVAQDPVEATYASMPSSAMEIGVDHVLKAKAIGGMIANQAKAERADTSHGERRGTGAEDASDQLEVEERED